ncbi:hypothetical protein [Lysinibacillus xylanilyticus]|uniref:hypothetical protein n=1 Tax=Lysinibacillus xylanilyticus TaxID=582475 RepID=UPI003D070A4C
MHKELLPDFSDIRRRFRPTDVFCAKTKRQQSVFVCAKAKRQQQHEVGHSVVATGRGVLRLSSSISADVWTPAVKN